MNAELIRKGRGETAASALGTLSILFWGSTIAFTRTMAEQLGTFTSAFWVYMIAGVLSSTYLLLRPNGIRHLLALPRRYIYVCGGIFVVYTLCIYVAIGWASGAQQAVEAGVINYLWPSLTLLLSIPILGKRPRPLLTAGILLAFGGVVTAMLGRGSYSFEQFVQNARAGMIPYAAAFGAAVTWALYSNLVRRWGGDHDGWALPLFLLAGAAALGLVRLGVSETSQWTPRAFAELAYVAVFPTFLAYAFWEAAMRRGNVILVASLSYFTPILSTFISGVHLGLRIGYTVWIACALVTIGAIVCNRSVTD